MSFNFALSGLNAASSDLNVTANNIANANTIGFKNSRAEFGDVFSATSYGLSRTASGNGTRLQDIRQQFKQGNINYTENTLDLAVSGEGFFTVRSDKGVAYTRAGAFGANDDGYVVNNAGQRLQVFPALAGGSFDTASLTDLRLGTADSPPKASSLLEVVANLPANASAPTVTPFSATDPNSYNQGTSVTLYDSLGTAHPANLYFVKSATAGAWDVHVTVDGTEVGSAQTIQFSGTGALTSPASGQLSLATVTPSNGATPLNLSMDIDKLTQYGSNFTVSRLTQDGYAAGELTGLNISDEGVVEGTYSNGQKIPLGKVALAMFSNAQGLKQLGDTAWAETIDSGPVLMGSAGTGSFGQVQSGALEASNVDLTAQLVNMITAQRNFQANAQMIQTSDSITQTIINIR